MGKGRAVEIVLDDGERRDLTALTRKHGAPQALAARARIVLAAADGLENKAIAAKVGVCAATVGTWRNRFAQRRLDGLYDEPRPGAPRWHVHFTPTSASWINQVERFFALLTERALKRGVFRSVSDLEQAIKAYIDATNADPKPFRWTKTADDILASIQRFCLRKLEAEA